MKKTTISIIVVIIILSISMTVWADKSQGEYDFEDSFQSSLSGMSFASFDADTFLGDKTKRAGFAACVYVILHNHFLDDDNSYEGEQLEKAMKGLGDQGRMMLGESNGDLVLTLETEYGTSIVRYSFENDTFKYIRLAKNKTYDEKINKNLAVDLGEFVECFKLLTGM